MLFGIFSILLLSIIAKQKSKCNDFSKPVYFATITYFYSFIGKILRINNALFAICFWLLILKISLLINSILYFKIVWCYFILFSKLCQYLYDFLCQKLSDKIRQTTKLIVISINKQFVYSRSYIIHMRRKLAQIKAVCFYLWYVYL